MSRIRCPHCLRIRVLFRQNSCKRCWTDLQPRYRVIEMPDGSVRHMATGHVAKQIGRSKGAETLHATGQAHRWTPAQARAAALLRWRRTPINKRIGVRLGLSVKRTKQPLDRPTLRRRYANGRNPIWYNVRLGAWMLRTAGGLRRIGEPAALKRLGYLKSGRGFVPSQLRPYISPATTTTTATSLQAIKSPRRKAWIQSRLTESPSPEPKSKRR